MEEEKSYSIFERLLFFLTPLLFTVLLLAALLAVFSPDIRGKMLDVGNQIPWVGSMLPNGPAKMKELQEANEKASASAQQGEEQQTAEEPSKQVKELQGKLAAKESELKQAQDAGTQQEQKIAELEKKVEELSKQSEQQQQSDEQYSQQIKELATMYTKMTPSKAAPILENMELEEMVLILNGMKTEDRAKIMAKMTPKVAADATVMMKDSVEAKDQQLAALQARVKRLTGQSSGAQQQTGTQQQAATKTGSGT
ncbi:MotE family protein [Paenibacillus sp. SYP-B4298]|uniref:MotE family protein n=1 Tax=Paenibacillus sp. SYP-B4298 TaxID=2996034 RepID=UPI0022DE4899|nr:MgtE protein [Paenibacillus sp. SYP-B4298]